MKRLIQRLLASAASLAFFAAWSAGALVMGLFAAAYGMTNEIVRDESFACDRSLDSGRFRAATGYRPPPWPDLVRAMHEDAVGSYKKETSA